MQCHCHHRWRDASIYSPTVAGCASPSLISTLNKPKGNTQTNEAKCQESNKTSNSNLWTTSGAILWHRNNGTHTLAIEPTLHIRKRSNYRQMDLNFASLVYFHSN